MRVLVLGATGMLGQDLVPTLKQAGLSVTAFGSKDLDLTNERMVREHKALSKRQHDWVINCSAYTAVDKAEDEPELAWDLNEEAVLNLASRCENGPRLLHISTDFVFDGKKETPYLEDDETNPLSTYGRTKLGGEHYVEAMTDDGIIFRTAWLYGTGGSCFPKTMIRLWRDGIHPKVVNDQIGSPTSTVDLAQAITQAICQGIPGGIYHAVGTEAMSWHQFAVQTLTLYTGQEIKLEAIGSDEFPAKAERPRYSVLSTDKLKSIGISPWRSTELNLTEFVEKIKTEFQGV